MEAPYSKKDDRYNLLVIQRHNFTTVLQDIDAELAYYSAKLR